MHLQHARLPVPSPHPEMNNDTSLRVAVPASGTQLWAAFACTREAVPCYTAGAASRAQVAAPPAHHHQVVGEQRRAAIVGAGPAGAACAISLATLGFKVDVIEVNTQQEEQHSRDDSAQLAAHESFTGRDQPQRPWFACLIIGFRSQSFARRTCAGHSEFPARHA